MEGRLILVRHALSAVERHIPSERWGLADGAVALCERLGETLATFDPAIVTSSTERKAIEAAAIVASRLGVNPAADDGFNEVRRPWLDTGYASAAGRYLRGGSLEGWELKPGVIARFEAAVARALAATESGTAVMATHGLAMTTWLASRDLVDPVTFWPGLTFPDAWSVDLEGRTVARCFVHGVTAPLAEPAEEASR